MIDMSLALWPSLAVSGIIGFLFHILAIWMGTNAAGIKRTGFIQLAIITLLSYIVLWLVKFFLWPLGWVLFGLFGFLAAVVSVAIATKMIIDTEWGKAWTVGFVSAFVYVVIAIIMGLIK